MKISTLVIAALASGSSESFGQHDALAAQSLLKLVLHVATEGVPEPKTCSLKNVRVRREWYVKKKHPSRPTTIGVRRTRLLLRGKLSTQALADQTLI
jgi:hypothetical protein